MFFAGVLFALFAAANPQSLAREKVYRTNAPPAAPAGGVYEAWVVPYDGQAKPSPLTLRAMFMSRERATSA